ncbi:MAG: hypothetical protein ACRDL5_14745, partial [Solirubrobacteraceae bacterium]
MFRLMPYVGGVYVGRTRVGHRHGYARLSIVLKQPARSVVAVFAAGAVKLHYFKLPARVRASLRADRAKGLLNRAVFVGYLNPRLGITASPATHLRFEIVYADGQRIS